VRVRRTTVVTQRSALVNEPKHGARNVKQIRTKLHDTVRQYLPLPRPPRQLSVRQNETAPKRISPFDDELGVFPDEVLVAEDEQGASVRCGDAGEADVCRPLRDVSQRGVRTSSASAAVVDASSVGRQVRHPAERIHRERETRQRQESEECRRTPANVSDGSTTACFSTTRTVALHIQSGRR